MTSIRLMVMSTLIVVAGLANAQTTAPAPTVPKLTCVKPDHYPGRLASENQIRAWQKDAKAWGECMKQYVADLQTQISDLQARLDTLIKPANAAIQEYNVGMKEFQEEIDKSK